MSLKRHLRRTEFAGMDAAFITQLVRYAGKADHHRLDSKQVLQTEKSKSMGGKYTENGMLPDYLYG